MINKLSMIQSLFDPCNKSMINKLSFFILNRRIPDFHIITHRIHGAAIYGSMDSINIPPMLAYIPPWIRHG